MQHCAICNASVGTDSFRASEVLIDLLKQADYGKFRPRAGTCWYLGRKCREIQHTPAHFETFVLTVAAGLVYTASRLCPACDFSDLPSVCQRMREPSFANTRHGAANHRYDRCSLYIYGELPKYYADPVQLVFAIILVRCCINDSTPAAAFFRRWRPSSFTWNEQYAINLMESV